MKSHCLIKSRLVVAALCLIGSSASVFAVRARADQWDKKTILTVNEPVQVQDKVLQPGQYVFKLHDSNSNRHVVQIFNSDQSQIIDTVLAVPNYRLQPTGNSRFAFWETPPGAAKAMRAWFYPGDNFGQEFTYPKHLAMLNAAVAASAPTPEASTAVPSAPAQPENPRTEEAQPMTQQAQPEQHGTLMAQNQPPTEAPSASEARTPKELPHSGSAYPLIGLGGLMSLGLYSLLRIKRPAERSR